VRLAAVTAAMLLLSVATTASLAASSKSKSSSYGAIAYHQASGSMGWATDRRTSREASMEALKQCGHEQCVVVASVTRNCAALARNPKKFAVQKGATRQEAETKALAKCGAGCEVAVWTCTR
jgi:hypothetical protein